MSILEFRQKNKDFLKRLVDENKIKAAPSLVKSKVKVSLKSDLAEEILIHQKALFHESQGGNYVQKYTELMTELFAMVQAGIDNPFSYIISDTIGWKSPLFAEHVEKERIDIMNIKKPMEVVDGIYTCPKCKSKKTFHYSRQLRSADEPMTTTVTCANTECQYRWNIN